MRDGYQGKGDYPLIIMFDKGLQKRPGTSFILSAGDEGKIAPERSKARKKGWKRE